MLAGIDYGNKRAGTTVICIGDEKGRIHNLFQSRKGSDADRFLLHMAEEFEIQSIFIDAPLSLPGVYRRPDKYSDYFYRRCDREMGAMSPMFLGGLTARAMKLKSEWNKKGIRVYEVWPRKLVEVYGMETEFYKKGLGHTERFFSFLKSRLEFMNEVSVENWHQLDAILAYLSGLNIMNETALSFGDPEEGIIYA